MPPLHGLHINNVGDSAAWDALRAARPALVKVVTPEPDAVRQMRREVQPDVVIGRFLLPNVDLDPTPEVAAERWYRQLRDRLMPLVGLLDYLEVPVNEAYERPPDLARYALACARFVELAAADGLAVLVGNFGRGTPEPEDFPAFLPALQAARRHGGALSLHEYLHRGRLDATWQIGRVKRFYDTIPADDHLPVYITEYGLDNGDLPGYSRPNAGWRDAGYGAPGDYVADLAAGVALYAMSCPWVRGVCLFNVGDYDSTWQSFDAHDPALIQWIATGPRLTTPPPPPSPAPEPPPTPGKTETMKSLHPWPAEWSQLRDRAYDADGDQNAARNCNLACITAFLHYAYGLNIPNDWLTEPLGLSYRGNTTIQQGVFLLRQFFGIECEVYGPGTASDALRPVVEKAVSRGYPAIVLCAGNGDTLKADTPHFLAAFGYDDQGVTLYDPWDGVARVWTWAEFEARQLFAQAYVPLRRRDAQLPPY